MRNPLVPVSNPPAGNSFVGRRSAYSRRNTRRITTELDFALGTPAANSPHTQEKIPTMATGLTASLARTAANYLIEPERLVVVGVDTADKAGDHPLLATKGEADRLKQSQVLEESLVLNIMAVGVRKAIFVRRNGDKFEVQDGRRRILHAREANKRLRAMKREPIKVEMVIKKVTDEQAFTHSRIDNRHHLPETPIQTTEAATKMIALGQTEEEVAAALGIGVPMLKIYLSLNDCAPQLRKAVEDGKLSPTAASKLVNLSREEQVEAFEKLAQNGEPITVAKTSAVRSASVSAKKNGRAPAKEVSVVPPRRTLSKLLELREAGAEELKEVDVAKGFWDGVSFALGKLNPKQVKGMTKAIHAATAKKSKASAANA